MNGPIEQRARELFEHASQQLEPATANRLRQARRAALTSSVRVRRLLPIAAAASLLAIALAWWLPRDRTTTPPIDSTAGTDAALIESDEDSEIYAWLGDAPVAPEVDNGGPL